MRLLVWVIAQCLFQRHRAQGVVIFNLRLRPVCRWRDTIRAHAHRDRRISRRGSEIRRHIHAEDACMPTRLSVGTSKIGGHCVKWEVAAKVLTHLLLPCGGLLGRWSHLGIADSRFNRDEHPASRRPVKGVSLPFIRYAQRSP